MAERVGNAPRKVQRVKIFVPKFTPSLRSWTANFCRKNYWRVSGFMDYDDLYQECLVKFVVCKQRYRKCDNEAHFASLYRTACFRMVMTYTNKRSRTPGCYQLEVDESQGEEYQQKLEDSLGHDHQLGYVATLVRQVPELKILVQAFADPQKREALRDVQRQTHPITYGGKLKYRETNNQLLCRALGLDPKQYNIAGAVDYYLRS